ncbi:VOC family protein [Mucilaginibacter gotjawali]|uniref:Lactoylglutathione lyase n=2 Tax=Mucilaginibacter gotjawali TaxID=1550579 RepID=A0A839SGB0_9SPHI|nr:VOC family protein [Mucilaginibacter gotjawali]MBB3056343.1 lactoylglutathione lyase [Mucilaginibacter gotjawali]BAU55047.1 Glyoxalase-like domain protein [Mucilaginibacter gotjawali]
MIKKSIIFKFLSIMLLNGVAFNVSAQVSPTSDHVALYVKDLKKSADFYENVMMLPVIPEPFHDGKHVWLRTGEHSQLHLIQGAAEVTEHDINSHFAYTVPNLADFTKHLDQMQVKYGNWKQDSKNPQLRPDGVKQVYLQDPDNIWIEVNDDKF